MKYIIRFSSNLYDCRAADDKYAEGDPFDFDEPDPAQCGASDSSLWELKTLKR